MAVRRVLVIDSDTDFADFLGQSLGSYGIQVEVIADGSEGLIYAQQTSPVALFIAVDLPDKVGYAICNK
ncbi:MAG: hypothetical protein V2A73_12895, partial [Pseudomonadota bacterium]